MVGVAVVCLTLITAAVVKREFFAPYPVARADTETPGRSSAAPPEPPVPVDDWQRVSRSGHRIGPSDAKLTIVVFSDFECPFCAKFATQVLPTLQQEFPGQVAMLFRQWPLPNHKWAYPAARASECAAAQGKFQQFHDAVFADQKSLGTKSFVTFAREAKVPIISQFEKCASATTPLKSVEEDIAEARRIGGRGTPTIVMNGLRLRPPYSPQALAEHARKAIEATSRQ